MNKFIFLKQKTIHIKHSNTDFWSHLYGTYKILKKYDKDQYICDAGLYHSIYDTERFKANVRISREEVIDLIGDKSENLVYIFCKLTGRTDFLLSIGNEVVLDGAHRTLTCREKLDILWIEYANLLEQSQRQQLKSLKTIEERLSAMLAADTIDMQKQAR